MSKKTKKFSTAQEDLVRTSYEITPIEEIGPINYKKIDTIQIVQIDIPFADGSLLDYSDDELTNEQLTNITNYFMTN